MFYSFMLFSIANINPTLKNILVAVKSKFKELITTQIFIIILLYSYTSIAFYWLRDRFETTIDMVSKY